MAADPSELWLGLDVEPVQYCLPAGCGYTLRHYRDGVGEDDVEPVLLGRNKVAYLFASTEGLVAFLRSGEAHDLADLPGWEVVAETPDIDASPDEMGIYQLDLVVEMLRAGPDSWDHELLILAGEGARDLAKYAELPDVLGALAAGSTLDSLDDDLRDGGFLARRRLGKLDGETLAIGWRTVISRLAAAVELRD